MRASHKWMARTCRHVSDWHALYLPIPMCLCICLSRHTTASSYWMPRDSIVVQDNFYSALGNEHVSERDKAFDSPSARSRYGDDFEESSSLLDASLVTVLFAITPWQSSH